MLRGSRSAYLSLFEEIPGVIKPTRPERRGRSEELLNKRNELLLHRHYYYIKIIRRQYQDTLDLLEDEFFLTQRTMVDMMQRSSILKELNAAKPPLKYFKEKYPWMVW